MSAVEQSNPTIELSEFQNLVMYAPEDCDLFLGGGRGGGKSYAIALMFLRHAELHGGKARMLFVRRTFPGVVDFEQVTREVFGLAYGPAASYNAGAHFWRLPGGATLQLDQMETVADFQKFQGKSFSMIAVDEAGHYPDPSPIDLLRSCLRAPAPIKPRFLLAANPGGVGHGWIVRRHINTARPWKPYVEQSTGVQFINCPSTLSDNPNLDQDAYRKQLEAATAYDPDLGKAWLAGDWSIARGAYFSAVLDEKRVKIEAWTPKTFPIRSMQAHGYEGPLVYDPNWRASASMHGRGAPFEMYLAHDFGVAAPSVTYVCAKSPGRLGPDERYYPRGSVILLDELATNEPGSLDRGMGYTVPRLADEIKEMCATWGMNAEGLADDAIFGRTGSASGSIASEFQRAGVNFYRAGKGDRLSGWEAMRRMLQDAGSLDRPGLYVSERCKYWWDTVPSLPRDPRKQDDVDSRAADHGADACRYAVLDRARHNAPLAITGAPYG